MRPLTYASQRPIGKRRSGRKVLASPKTVGVILVNLERMHRRAAVIRTIRSFFDAQGFLEVDTPIALTAPAPEMHIEAPLVEFTVGRERWRRFLQTSPELAMKRLLAAGLVRVYQIAPVFRDRDFSPTHRPEFRMLEWYRRGENFDSLLSDCEGLFTACVGGSSLTYQGVPIDLSRPWRRVRMDDAFRAHAGFSILDALTPPLLRAQLDRLELPHQASDEWDDLFHRVFLSLVEPAILADPRPVFLTHYPAPLASLARRDPADPRASERFELYVAGLELANGFGELTDASEQRARFLIEKARRRAAGYHDYPLDERFLAALAELPPSAGIALGVDRLLMLILDVADIDAAGLIPWTEV